VADPLWPLFDLRLRTGDLELRLPTEPELTEFAAVARAGIHPATDMPFGVAWTDVGAPDFERSFFQFHLGHRATWTPARWVLPLGVWVAGAPAGFQDLVARDFPTLRTVSTGSWLGTAFQGHGVGKLMRQAVLALAFEHLGAEIAESEAFLDNHASNRVSLAVGYEPNGFGRLAPRATPRETQRFRMTLEGWQARERPQVTIEGVELCLELFGAASAT
jgi:RimJ/RimL family protein N-acetyltransferase